MPVVPRQLLLSEISEALQPRTSTSSTAVIAPTLPTVPEPVASTTTTQSPILPPVPIIPGLTSLVVSTSTTVIVSPTAVLIPPVTTTTTSATPTTTTTTSSTSTTEPVTSLSSLVIPPTPSTSSLLSLTTPETSNTPDVAPTTKANSIIVTASASISTSASATATGVASNAGSATQDGSNMSGGIIALIVIGALLAALLAGAFIFRRVQVRRRAKRREINYGADVSDSSPFPFTNVSEADLKGAQPIRDPAVSYKEKPLPSIVPDVYPAPPNPTYNQFGQYSDGAMSGPYPTMGTAAMGYGYGQPGRASPAPSQIQPQRMVSPAPPPVAYAPGPSAYSSPYPQAPTSAPNVPASNLAVPQTNGGKKRVIQTFQPTLPDELDIRDGDWVIVLHAYDDGWGLCECNGRRGVVPLECLDLGRPDFRASRRFSSLSAIRQ
ncbi:Src-like protein 3 domain, partial [Rhizoctonia solani]